MNTGSSLSMPKESDSLLRFAFNLQLVGYFWDRLLCTNYQGRLEVPSWSKIDTHMLVFEVGNICDINTLDYYPDERLEGIVVQDEFVMLVGVIPDERRLLLGHGIVWDDWDASWIDWDNKRHIVDCCKECCLGYSMAEMSKIPIPTIGVDRCSVRRDSTPK